MGFVSLSELQPTKISRDLKGKYVLLYGKPKAGKTSMAANFPRNLLLATEVGYHGLASIYAVDIDTWSTFKKYLRELDQDTAKEKFDTITIDTISILWDLCEKYICQQHDVQTLGDVPYGKAYRLCEKEFSEALRKITLMGYGLVFIAHSEIRVEKVGDSEVEFIAPALNKRPFAIINALVDIIGYIGTEFDKEGNSIRKIYTRQTPTIMAGSRFKHLVPVIPLGYTELANALADAIEKSGKLDGAIITDQQFIPVEQVARPFEETMLEAKELFLSLSDDEQKLELVNKSIKEWFGTEMFRLSEAQPSQQELVESVIADMRAIR